ncbi:YidB family protein, partial [Methylocapsa acidiphila]|uniref:YidB family protein n=1 Tax=Methylocapsa acidiphila TaxID=133552 RepID=UPI0003F92A7E
MGLLDGLLGGTVGAALVTAANELIEKQGGIEGLVKQFQEKGLAGTIQSWISTGDNLPIAPEQLQSVLGSDLVKNLAAKVGIPPEELAKKLSELLPTAVDKLTPEGKLPS